MFTALAESSAGLQHESKSECCPGALAKPARARAVSEFETLIRSPDYPCVGAKAALQREACRFRFYGELGEIGAATHCTADLQQFAAISKEIDKEFATFIAIFAGPSGMGEQQFSEQLWRQLSLMAQIDQESNQWDAAYSSDPTHHDFAMSIGGQAFYIIGLHPGASRVARQFPH